MSREIDKNADIIDQLEDAFLNQQKVLLGGQEDFVRRMSRHYQMNKIIFTFEMSNGNTVVLERAWNKEISIPGQ